MTSRISEPPTTAGAEEDERRSVQYKLPDSSGSEASESDEGDTRFSQLTRRPGPSGVSAVSAMSHASSRASAALDMFRCSAESYSGPYTLLAGFIDAMRDAKHVSQSSADRLQRALQELADGRVAFRFDQSMSEDDKTGIAEVLMGFGMSMNDMHDVTASSSLVVNSRKRRQSVHSAIRHDMAMVIQRWWRGRKRQFRNVVLDAMRNTTVKFDAFLEDFGFNVFTFNSARLGVPLACYTLQKFGLEQRFNVAMDGFKRWCTRLVGRYHPNPYHAWHHAVDVMQMCAAFLHHGLDEYLTYADYCSVLVGALMHDVGHVGRTNPFLIASRHQLAIMYSDRSPLESMHCAVGFELYFDSGCQFLRELPREEFEKMRMRIIEAVMATDNAYHFALVDKFVSRVQRHKKGEEAFVTHAKSATSGKRTSKDDRQLLVHALLHQADIGNALRPFDVYKHAVVSLETEFFLQGDHEKELEVPVSMLMDREKDSLAAAQSFWISKMVLPLYTQLQTFITERQAKNIAEQAETNQAKWAELLAKHGTVSAQELAKQENWGQSLNQACAEARRSEKDWSKNLGPTLMSPSTRSALAGTPDLAAVGADMKARLQAAIGFAVQNQNAQKPKKTRSSRRKTVHALEEPASPRGNRARKSVLSVEAPASPRGKGGRRAFSPRARNAGQRLNRLGSGMIGKGQPNGKGHRRTSHNSLASHASQPTDASGRLSSMDETGDATTRNSRRRRGPRRRSGGNARASVESVVDEFD